jgi:hypothetical protein
MSLAASISLVTNVSAIVRNIGYEQELLITDYDMRFLTRQSCLHWQGNWKKQ